MNRFRRFFFEGDVLRLMGLAFLAKPLGLLTQTLMANYFGASARYDAYVLALFLATFVNSTLGRVFAAVAVPFLVRLRRELDPRRLGAAGNGIFLLFLAPALAYMTLLLARGDWPLVLAAPGASDETVALSARMLRTMAVPGLFMFCVAMLGANLNANKHFKVPASMPVLNSLVTLLVVFLFHERFGVWVLPLAFAAAQTAQVLASLARSLGAKLLVLARPAFPRDRLARLWGLSWMITVSTTFQTVNAFLDKLFASGLEAGSISAIAYSTTIMNLWIQVFTMSLVTVMFTRMAELIAAGDLSGCSDYMERNIVKIARVVVPAALGISLASDEVIRVLFQRGAFDAAAAARTSDALSMYVLGLPALIINAVVTRAFHSLQRMRDKMWLALQYLATNAAGNLLLVGALGILGLAISSTVAIHLHVFLSLWVLARYDCGLEAGRFAAHLLRHYLIAVAVWILYRASGAEAALDGFLVTGGFLEALLVGAARFLLTVVLFAALLGALKLVRRRR